VLLANPPADSGDAGRADLFLRAPQRRPEQLGAHPCQSVTVVTTTVVNARSASCAIGYYEHTFDNSHLMITFSPRTPSTFADGYEVLRSTTDGGPYASVGTVSGQATTTFTDTTATSLTTYYFVVQSTRHLWRSVDSTQAAATVPLSLCTG
jgi:hypothetical protein